MREDEGRREDWVQIAEAPIALVGDPQLGDLANTMNCVRPLREIRSSPEVSTLTGHSSHRNRLYRRPLLPRTLARNVEFCAILTP